MRVCLVAEGCYPYVVGGVSGWIDSMIRSFPNIEFILLSIVSDRSVRGNFLYNLPENLTQVHEVYLNDYDWTEKRKRRVRLDKDEYQALKNIVFNEKTNWDIIFDLFHKKNISVNNLLMSKDFYHIARSCYDAFYPNINFSDFLWTLRSIYLPLFLVLKTDVPKADLYHCVSTGYAGVLGCMGKYFHNARLMISEHGIYTREREEEIIKAGWVKGVYKNIWIDQFKKISLLAYQHADRVTCLYKHAKELQIELGCPSEKIMITPNGIDIDHLRNLPLKNKDEEKMINIGAILRVAPIKDIKTMIQSFAIAKEKVKNLKLWIMGPTDEDEEYAKECSDLIQSLKLKDVIFTGRIDIHDYLGKMDFTILTSISEGMPLTILESFAAHKPVIATDVGNCKELIYGTEDNFGPAGIVTHIMNINEIANAMVRLSMYPQDRETMGSAGYKRVKEYYSIEQMKETYRRIYRSFALEKEIGWNKETFRIGRRG